MSRLIVLSNRIPDNDVPSGGLVVALHQCLKSVGGLWVGSRSGGARNLEVEPETEGYRKARFGLSANERENYYLGYSNSVLWPLCHRRTDLMRLSRRFYDDYLAVNRRVAREIARLSTDDDLIWVHDYHFFPMAAELRQAQARGRIGFFLHIPFPTSTDLAALPQADEFHSWLAAYDLVGLQTEGDVARCLELFRAHPEAELLTDGAIKFRDRVFRVASFPIGIDVDGFNRIAEPGGRKILGLGDERLAIGVERLDYSKGLPQRLAAFETWLSGRSRKALTYLQIAAPSRDEVGAYQSLARELRETAGRINATHSTLNHTPLKLLFQPTPRDTLATLFRASDLGLVTPLADGMNLVAKEFVAAQDPEDPGVLILSRNAGAAEALHRAIIVNPFDPAELADAMSEGLSMSRTERIDRHADLIDAVRKSDIRNWGNSFLSRLRERSRFELGDGLTDRVNALSRDAESGYIRRRPTINREFTEMK